MRGLTHRWTFREPAEGAAILAELGLPALVERVLAARGFRDADETRRFCDPRLNHLHDPSLLPGADAAAERLVETVRQGRRVAIYGDYDVDGITAIAILHKLLTTAAPGASISTYVPHRLEEGYGLNVEALDELRRSGVDLVVSVDCGVTAVEAARHARTIGLELIVTDHHQLREDGLLPEATIVHPRLPGSLYPFPDLCGAGVAFKLAWRFATAWSGSERVGAVLQSALLDVLPLVALGTIADVVPLVGENRVLVAAGLSLLPRTTNAGLRAMIDAAGFDGAIDTERVAFILAPRLNACGRMGHAKEAVRLMTEAGADEAHEIARMLTEQNAARQKTERRITEQAVRLAEAGSMTGDDRRTIVLAEEGWHPGVVGIACSRLVERFGRPVLLLDRQGALCRGSGRSIDGFDLAHALYECREHLLEYGGHEAAAGLSLATDALSAFAEAFESHARTLLAPDDLTPALRIDCEATLEEIDIGAVERLAMLSPFGRQNERPRLCVRGVRLAQPPQAMGANGQHLALRLECETERGRRALRGVWWHGAPFAARLAAGMRLDVVIEPKLNTWQGRTSVEPEIRDARIV